MAVSIAEDTRERLLEILAGNWNAEIRNHYTYKTLAEREPDPGLVDQDVARERERDLAGHEVDRSAL